jgi:serine/threonine-protein kinase
MIDSTAPLHARSDAEPRPAEKASLFGSLDGDPAALQSTVALGSYTPPHDLDARIVGQELDRYQVRELLGFGEMGRVYLAWHRQLHRESALKVIAPEIIAAHPERLDMFRFEARAAARLNHPNIVAVHDLGEDSGLHFVEMEYVPGGSLKDFLKANGPADNARATRLAAEIAAGLGRAHAEGIIHCDVKPGNVMLDRHRRARLADFGLARALSDKHASDGSRIVGTPYYMAPELFDGVASNARSDIYALGVTWFNLLTADMPYRAESLRELQEMHRQPHTFNIASLKDRFNPAVVDQLTVLLHRDPACRPESADKLAEELHRLSLSLEDIPSLITRGIRTEGITWSAEGDGYRFRVELGNGRHQVIHADVEPVAEFGTELFRLWTPCAPATESSFAEMLRLNDRMPFGAIALRELEGRTVFVMVQNLHRAALDPEEIQDSVLSLARWADAVEKKLTGKDAY